MHMTIPLEDDKYVITMIDHKITVTRHGEPWEDYTGSGFMLALLNQLAEAECKIGELNQELAETKGHLNQLITLAETYVCPPEVQPDISMNIECIWPSSNGAMSQVTTQAEAIKEHKDIAAKRGHTFDSDAAVLADLLKCPTVTVTDKPVGTTTLK